MNIVLVTPLYPPEVAEPAPYTKELARRLSGSHRITVVTYSHLPEQLPGVSVIAVEKNRPLPLRLFSFFVTLVSALKGADVCYAQNGPSVELPLTLALLVTRTPLVMHIGDPAAHHYAQSHFLRRLIERIAFVRAKTVVSDSPLPRPEILPLEPHPTEAFIDHEQSWKKHLEILEQSFDYEH